MTDSSRVATDPRSRISDAVGEAAKMVCGGGAPRTDRTGEAVTSGDGVDEGDRATCCDGGFERLEGDSGKNSGLSIRICDTVACRGVVAIGFMRLGGDFESRGFLGDFLLCFPFLDSGRGVVPAS